MKSLLLSLSFLLFLASCASTNKQVETNKKIVVDFYEMTFNQHEPTKASKLYIGDHYIQHNPYVPNGAEPFYSYLEDHFKKNPESHAIIKRVIAEGDLVALHVHSKLNKKDKGEAVVDIFRVENGKIVEHFDVIQEVPAKIANGNTMFEGSKKD